MDDNSPENDDLNGAENVNILQALKQFIIRICIASINKDTLDNSKLSEVLDRHDSVDILRKFISSAESSIVFIEDATSVGGEGMAAILVTFLERII